MSLLIQVPEHLRIVGSVVGLSAAIATTAVLYAELLFRSTKWLYDKGLLKRYGPLPLDRNLTSNWLNAFGFLLPSFAYAHFSSSPWTWSWPGVLELYVHTWAYMMMHDAIFYWLHRTFHASKTLYNLLHSKHHEYSKSLNVFVVGFAEVSENMLQVGVPWLIWTMFVARKSNAWLAVVPMSVTIYTTLLGHSGYKMHPILFLFHPWAAISLLPIVNIVLTPGDHQMHHVYRRVNMGLFFRCWDRSGETYRQNCIPSHDVKWWNTEMARREEQEEKDDATDGAGAKVLYEDVEVSFGF